MTASMKVTIESRIEPAELNQELFDKVFGKDVVKSEEEFVNKVKKPSPQTMSVKPIICWSMKLNTTWWTHQDFIAGRFLKHWLKTQAMAALPMKFSKKEFNEYFQEFHQMDLIKKSRLKKNKISVESGDVRNGPKNWLINQFGGEAAAELERPIDQITDNYLQGNNGQNLYAGL